MPPLRRQAPHRATREPGRASRVTRALRRMTARTQPLSQGLHRDFRGRAFHPVIREPERRRDIRVREATPAWRHRDAVRGAVGFRHGR